VFQSLGALGSNIRTKLNSALNSDAQRGAHVEAARAADAARKRADRAEMSPAQLAVDSARVAGNRGAAAARVFCVLLLLLLLLLVVVVF
jgi:hypothetical protein